MAKFNAFKSPALLSSLTAKSTRTKRGGVIRQRFNAAGRADCD
jgi:hypothetical protein